ncbi:hypothetical protein BC832DRAFT_299157, partial [Gaertneriomyces semiglobifer]
MGDNNMHETLDMTGVSGGTAPNYVSTPHAPASGSSELSPMESRPPHESYGTARDQTADRPSGQQHVALDMPATADDDIETLLNELGKEARANPHQRHEEEQLDSKGLKVTCKVPEEMLRTDPNQGLNHEEAEKRKRKFGPNQLAEHKENKFLKFLGFFRGPIQYVMFAAAALAGGLQDWVDLGVIIGLLLLNAAVGFVQEYQAGNIVAQLKSQLALHATVVRGGVVSHVDSVDVVPGDIVVLEEGVIIPADGKILGEQAILQVDQA